MDEKIVSDDAVTLAESVSLHTRAANRGLISLITLTILISFGVEKEGAISLFGMSVSKALIDKYFIFIIVLFNINFCMNRVQLMDASAMFFAFVRSNDPFKVMFTHPNNGQAFRRADILHRLHQSSLDRIFPLFSVFPNRWQSNLTFLLRPVTEVIIVAIPYVAIAQTYRSDLLRFDWYGVLFFLSISVSVIASAVMFYRAFLWGREARDKSLEELSG